MQWARAAGFEHINLDLIYGANGETVASWERTLWEKVLSEKILWEKVLSGHVLWEKILSEKALWEEALWERA